MRFRKSKTPVRGIVEETLDGMEEYNKLIVNRGEIKLIKEASEEQKNGLYNALINASAQIIYLDEREVSNSSLTLAMQVYETLNSEYNAIKSFNAEVNKTYNEINSIISKIDSAIETQDTLKKIGNVFETSLTGYSLDIPAELIGRIYSLKDSSNLIAYSTSALLELKAEGR